MLQAAALVVMILWLVVLVMLLSSTASVFFVPPLIHCAGVCRMRYSSVSMHCLERDRLIALIQSLMLLSHCYVSLPVQPRSVIDVALSLLCLPACTASFIH